MLQVKTALQQLLLASNDLVGIKLQNQVFRSTVGVNKHSEVCMAYIEPDEALEASEV